MDPFGYFMDVWAPSCGIAEAFSCWLIKNERQAAPYVVADLTPFRDTSGKEISGRKAWREHLASTGTVEMGHADLKAQAERHQERQDAHRLRVGRAVEAAPIVPANVIGNVAETSRAAQRVMERLHGRPTPDRPTLIKMAIEERMRK